MCLCISEIGRALFKVRTSNACYGLVHVQSKGTAAQAAGERNPLWQVATCTALQSVYDFMFTTLPDRNKISHPSQFVAFLLVSRHQFLH